MNSYGEQYNVVINLILSRYCINRELLFGKSRQANIVEARQVFSYLMRKYFQLSFPAIGKILNRDHTTILYACKRMEYLLLSDTKLKKFILKVTSELDLDKDIILEDIENDKSENENSNELLKQINGQNKIEEIEYNKLFDSLRNQRDRFVRKYQDKYNDSVKKLNQRREKQTGNFKKALNSYKKGNIIEAREYICPKKDLIKDENLKESIKVFLPKYKNDVREYNFPLEFGENYLSKILSKLNIKTKDIIINRYGFFNSSFSTLDAVAFPINISRQRVQQIIDKGIKKIYFNNYGATRQILVRLSEEIIRDDIISVERFNKQVFLYDNKDKRNSLKFLLIISSITRWIKKFEFSGKNFFININEESKIIQHIDDVKHLIRKIYEIIPDLVDDKWQYVYDNLKLYEYFQEYPSLLDKNFLRACYDNYLFESEVTIYKTENIKKYDIEVEQEKRVIGVPNEYKIFFQ